MWESVWEKQIVELFGIHFLIKDFKSILVWFQPFSDRVITYSILITRSWITQIFNFLFQDLVGRSIHLFCQYSLWTLVGVRWSNEMSAEKRSRPSSLFMASRSVSPTECKYISVVRLFWWPRIPCMTPIGVPRSSNIEAVKCLNGWTWNIWLWH